MPGESGTKQSECDCKGGDTRKQCTGPTPEHWRSDKDTSLYNLSGWVSTTSDYLLSNHVNFVDYRLVKTVMA